MVIKADLTLDREHTTPYTDDVLRNSTPETDTFINHCHPSKFSHFLNKMFN